MSFLLGWVKGFLSYLGIWNLEAKMLFLGLDNAGKTTLLGKLSEGRLISPKPTIQPNQADVTINRLQFKTFDLGGHPTARPLWRDYFVETDVIVFLVDANDRSEAKCELDGLLKDDTMANVPILVLGNKIDMLRAASEQELRNALGLQVTTGKARADKNSLFRPIEVFMCSVSKNAGLVDAFNWVSQNVKGR